MPTAELVTAHVELLLEEAGVRDMSQENVELAARWYEPWATTSKAELLADLPKAMELCHPEVAWSQREEGRTLRGREGVREALEGWLDSFNEYRFEVWRIFACGFDEVLVVGLEVGRGAISGAEVRSHTYELLTFRDGQIVRFRDFHDEREALEAVALPETTSPGATILNPVLTGERLHSRAARAKLVVTTDSAVVGAGRPCERALEAEKRAARGAGRGRP